jgi:hypothetical protein
MLAYLTDKGLAVFTRHPIPGLNANLGIHLILEILFKFLCSHIAFRYHKFNETISPLVLIPEELKTDVFY